MYIFNISEPLTLVLLLIATVLLIFLSQEVKKSYVAAIPLFAYLVLIIIHVVQLATLTEEFKYLSTTLYYCLGIDFIFIFLSFIGYLWIDDIEAKETGKKSVSNSLDWFWRNV